VPETQPVLEPDFSGAYQSPEGYGTNKVAAEIALRESGAPVSILRASRIHGIGGSPQREWFVVKRLLDGRHRIPTPDPVRRTQRRCASRVGMDAMGDLAAVLS
jgi:nucleoside-diphosphate-sugar epimerase